jgi:glycosyltransferase involved in cell wall biosynthesis
VQFVGQLSPVEFCNALNAARAFILPTAYETFSVVTAEALCCGCPVVANNVGAVAELVDASNGMMVRGDDWEQQLLSEFGGFDRQAISEAALEKYDSAVIGRHYFKLLQTLQ